MAPARFITFEGGEGSGKSTQAARLAERLRSLGHDVVVTREPGGTPFAEAVRALILDPATPRHAALSEALLFYAARADHLETVIRPALAAGRIVICDRFSDSTRVYQSLVGGLPERTIAALEHLVVAPTRPALTLILDLAPATGLARADARRTAVAPDRYEARDLDFHQRLREGFAAIARAEPHRCTLIDAGAPPEAVAAAVWRAVAERLGLAAAACGGDA